MFIGSKTKTGREIIDCLYYAVDASRDRRLKARYRRRQFGASLGKGRRNVVGRGGNDSRVAVGLSHLRQARSLRTSSQLRPERLAKSRSSSTRNGPSCYHLHRTDPKPVETG